MGLNSYDKIKIQHDLKRLAKLELMIYKEKNKKKKEDLQSLFIDEFQCLFEHVEEMSEKPKRR